MACSRPPPPRTRALTTGASSGLEGLAEVRAAGSDERTQLKCLLTAGPDTDSGDRRSRHLLLSTHVGLVVLRKFVEFPGAGDVLGPAFEVLVHGFGVVGIGLWHGAP